MSSTYTRYPGTSSSSGSITSYANAGALPASASDGAFAVTLDTDAVYVYNLATTGWKKIGSPSAVFLDTLLVGDVTGTPAASVVSSVGGSSAANLHSAELLANAATAVKTNGAIAKRDGSGAIAADITGNLTGNVAGNLTGNVTGNVTGNTSGTASSITGNLTGDVTSVGMATTVATVGGSTAANVNTATALVNGSQSGNKLLSSPSGGGAGVPAFRALVGADLPNPSSSSLGGVQSKAKTTSQWIDAISTSGVPSASQPAFSDLSGSVASTQMPALTGDVTTTAGTVATTIASGAVTNAKIAANAAIDRSKLAPLTIVSKTSAYTLASADDVVFASGSAFTLTLPAASSNSGKVFYIKKTDASLTNIITVARAGSDTIDGATSTTVNTQYEIITIVSDGTSTWNIIARDYPKNWVAWTPTFTGFGSGGTAPTGIFFVSRRVGDSLEFRGNFNSGTSTATEARISLGYGGTDGNVTSSDSTKLPSISIVGEFVYSIAAGTFPVILGEQSKGYVTFGFQDGSRSGVTKQQGSSIAASGNAISLQGIIPITGWN